MSVRKTESRLPSGAQPEDLGQAVMATDGRCVLISAITAPLAVDRENFYVVFVIDPMLIPTVTSYMWTFMIDGVPVEFQTTPIGQVRFTPKSEGYLIVKVLVMSGGPAPPAELQLMQQVAPPNVDLEALIAAASEQPGAGMGNPDVLRELINDHNPYYQDVPLSAPEAGDAFSKFLFSTVNDGALETKQEKRHDLLEEVAASINTGETDFVSAIGPGLGVAKLRLPLLVMMLSPASIPFTELPETNAENVAADEQLRQQMAAMPEEDRIDWFNLVRFPKSNIALCAKLLEALRDKFFPGVVFEDVLKKMSGSMSDWIMLNYNKGPLHRN
jgi:hypothetical protein